MKPVKNKGGEFEEIINLINESRRKAFQSVNKELIRLNLQIGKYLSAKVDSDEWGSATIEELADYIKTKYPGIRGYTSRNLWRMKQFYEIYKEDEKLTPLVSELSWTNNLIILNKCKSPEEREFYLNLAFREKYSKRELERQIDSGYFERTMLSSQKLSTPLTQMEKNQLAPFRDKYVFEFLDLPENFSEKDLQKGLLTNLRRFLLELGKDFSFIAEEYRLQVGNNDYYVDLLLYHRELQCLVAIELKIDDFKPEYLGKLSFYLEALDRDVKKEHEQPSIGILLCKSKDAEVVEYAMNRNLSPALVAEYETKLINKKLLQQKLHEFFELNREIQ